MFIPFIIRCTWVNPIEPHLLLHETDESCTKGGSRCFIVGGRSLASVKVMEAMLMIPLIQAGRPWVPPDSATFEYHFIPIVMYAFPQESPTVGQQTRSNVDQGVPSLTAVSQEAKR